MTISWRKLHESALGGWGGLTCGCFWGRNCRKQINREEGLVLQEVKSAAIVLLTELCLVSVVASCRLHHQRHKKQINIYKKTVTELTKVKSFIMLMDLSKWALWPTVYTHFSCVAFHLSVIVKLKVFFFPLFFLQETPATPQYPAEESPVKPFIP